MKNGSIEIMKLMKLEGMVGAYEAVLSLPVNQQPDAHEMLANLVEASNSHFR